MKNAILNGLMTFAVALGLLGSNAEAKAQASITLNTNPDSSVRPGQEVVATGKLTINGRPAPAGVPVVLFFRSFAGNDTPVNTGMTDGNGNFRLTGTVSRNAMNTVQVSVVSGGSPQAVARKGKILTVTR